MLCLSDAKAQCVPRVAPCVLLRTTSIKLSHLLILKKHYIHLRGLRRRLAGKLSRTPAARWPPLLLLHGSKTGTIGRLYTRTRTHVFLQGHGAPKRTSLSTRGAPCPFRRRDLSLFLGVDQGWRANGRLFCGK